MQHVAGRPVIALLTDFGMADGYVGVMKGVMLSIVPDAQLVDLTHDVPAQRVAAGAWILSISYRYFPAGTIFVCVVDPGVGSAREAIALHAGDWYFIGPDNGLFSSVYAEQPVREAVELTNPLYHRSAVSSTFHGRDIFAPVAAHLARGVPLKELGASIDPAILQRFDSVRPSREKGEIQGRIAHIDHFGNLITTIPLSLVPDLFTAPRAYAVFPTRSVSSQFPAPIERRHTFFARSEEDGVPFLYGDSSGYVGIAVRNDSAVRMLGVDYGMKVTLVIAGE